MVMENFNELESALAIAYNTKISFWRVEVGSCVIRKCSFYFFCNDNGYNDAYRKKIALMKNGETLRINAHTLTRANII